MRQWKELSPMLRVESLWFLCQRVGEHMFLTAPWGKNAACFNSSGMILQRDVELFSLFGKVKGLWIYFIWFSWEQLLACRSDCIIKRCPWAEAVLEHTAWGKIGEFEKIMPFSLGWRGGWSPEPLWVARQVRAGWIVSPTLFPGPGSLRRALKACTMSQCPLS